MGNLEQTIEHAISDILKEKTLFEKFEIPEKYEKCEGQNLAVKVFDFWHSKFRELERKAKENNQAFEHIKCEIQKAFYDSYNATQQLANELKKFDQYILKECRANIEFVNRTIRIIVLFDIKDSVKVPEELIDFNSFIDTLCAFEDSFRKEYEPYEFDCRALYYKDVHDIDSLRNDYPLFAKFPL